MINTYMIDRPINCMRGQKHVILSVGKYETGDIEIIRIIHSYPNVRFLNSRPSDPATGAGGQACDPLSPTSEPAVKTAPGLQLREKRTGCSTSIGLGSRIAETD